MKRGVTLVAVLALALSMFAGVSAADEHGDTPEHGHIRLLHATWTGPGVGPGTEVLSYRKCVDLAGGNALPLQAHHDTVHTGRAGQALRGAGHLTIPTFPLTGIRSCADLPPSIP
jgi:hypothetical protein